MHKKQDARWWHLSGNQLDAIQGRQECQHYRNIKQSWD